MKSACPICHHEFATESRQSPFPFCSWRCKQVDLYRWLNGEYRFSVPIGPDALDELEAVADDSNREAPS